MAVRHLIEPTDFNDDETMAVLDLADRIAAAPEMYAHVADGKKLATLFYEPSTRTRLSFESAMLSLAGRRSASPEQNSPVQPKEKRLLIQLA